MTAQRRIAIAHEQILTADVPDPVNRILVEAVWERREEIDEKLKPFGLVLADILQPSYRRIVRVKDVQSARSYAREEHIEASS